MRAPPASRRGRRRARPMWLRWLALPLSALIAVAGCAGGSADIPTGTARAAAYVDAWHQAWAAGFTDVALFLAPEATMDRRGYGGSLTHGRADAAQALRADWWGYDLPEVFGDEPAYLSADGAVDPSRIAFGDLTVPEAPVYRITREGILSELWTGSLYSGMEHVGLDRAEVDRITRPYLAAWRDGRGGGLDELYAEDATVTDSLLGVSLAGREQIASLLTAGPGQGGLKGAEVRAIAEDGGPATYLASTWDGFTRGPLLAVIMLLDLPRAGGCPGPVAVDLRLDPAGQVATEHRYHRADTVDQCLDPQGRAVWWDDVEVPDPAAFVRTGTLAVGAPAQLWNGTAGREELLRWALRRFADGRLPPPEPRSVTFTPPDPDPWDTYGFVPGEPDVPLPDSAEGCSGVGCEAWPAAARVESLTALAHLWIADPARSSIRGEYADATRQAWTLPAPDGARFAPLGPAAHRAAHTIAWGLMDEPYPLPDGIASLSCDQLAAEFLMLTAAVTAGAACGTG